MAVSAGRSSVGLLAAVFPPLHMPAPLLREWLSQALDNRSGIDLHKRTIAGEPRPQLREEAVYLSHNKIEAGALLILVILWGEKCLHRIVAMKVA